MTICGHGAGSQEAAQDGCVIHKWPPLQHLPQQSKSVYKVYLVGFCALEMGSPRLGFSVLPCKGKRDRWVAARVEPPGPLAQHNPAETGSSRQAAD